MNPNESGATYRCRSAGIQLGITSFGFTLLAFIIAGNPGSALRASLAIAGVVTLQTIGIVVLAIINALVSPPEADDERDAWIARRSTRLSAPIITTGVVIAIGAIVAQQFVLQVNPSASGEFLLNGLLPAYLLMLVLSLGEGVRFASLLYDYKRTG